jgi:hypothetical protein
MPSKMHKNPSRLGAIAVQTRADSISPATTRSGGKSKHSPDKPETPSKNQSPQKGKPTKESNKSKRAAQSHVQQALQDDAQQQISAMTKADARGEVEALGGVQPDEAEASQEDDEEEEVQASEEPPSKKSKTTTCKPSDKEAELLEQIEQLKKKLDQASHGRQGKQQATRRLSTSYKKTTTVS